MAGEGTAKDTPAPPVSEGMTADEGRTYDVDDTDSMREIARELTTGGMIAALTAEVAKLARAVGALETTWRAELAASDERVSGLERKRTRDLVAFGIAAAVVSAFVLYAVVSLDRLREVALVNKGNAEVLLRCTTPTPAGAPAGRHACFEDSRAFSVGLTLAIVECSGLPHEATPAERRKCVADALASADTAEVAP